jgi:hypothetical protein
MSEQCKCDSCRQARYGGALASHIEDVILCSSCGTHRPAAVLKDGRCSDGWCERLAEERGAVKAAAQAGVVREVRPVVTVSASSGVSAPFSIECPWCQEQIDFDPNQPLGEQHQCELPKAKKRKARAA